MKDLQNMMASHPQATSNTNQLSEAAHHIAMCAAICTSCADACLAEPMVEQLRHCIRLNLDCADVCAATSRALIRQTETGGALVRELLGACAAACRACAVECARHADMHEHCRICAEHCRQCAQICESVMSAFVSA